MPGSFADRIDSLDVLPVRCPRCSEAQNTLEGAVDPLAPGARIRCMVCGHAFEAEEYRRLLDERLREFQGRRIGARAETT